jgi:two-component system, LytTR family, response regulator
MKIRTLIVDDMLLARKRVKRYLANDPDIEIVGEASDGREAVEAVRELKPDLMLLDVQMPEVDGFEVISRLSGEKLPLVIFITAFDHFALRAFEVHAVDYLLKPFDAERLQRALERAKVQLQHAQHTNLESRMNALLQDITGTPRNVKRLAVKTNGRTIFLNVDEIDWIEAAGNYLKLQAGKESHMIRERISQIENKLDSSQFVRIHRSYIVNLDRIKEMQPLFNGDQVVILRSGKRLTMSRTYRDRLMSLLDSF